MPRPVRPLLAVALVALLACALHAVPSSAGEPAGEPVASIAAKCVVKKQVGNRLVTVFTHTYRYKFSRIKKTKRFKRVIVRIRVSLKGTCGRNCVVQKKRGKKKKLTPIFVYKRVTTKVKRHGRIVTKRVRKKVFKLGTCPELKQANSLGAPVTVRVLNTSKAILDFGAFQREAPVSGQLKGFVPGGIQLGKDQQVNLTSGTLKLSQTPVFIDDDCDGQVSAAIRTGDPATIELNPGKRSTSTLTAGGTVTSIVYTRIKLPLQLRNDDGGCNQPYISTGYSLFEQTFFLRGKLGAKGLADIPLTSAPDTLDVLACLSPGNPTQPCSGFEVPLPILASTSLHVAIDLK